MRPQELLRTMNCHDIPGERLQQIFKLCSLRYLGIAVPSHLIEFGQDHWMSQTSCSICRDKWIGIRCQHGTRTNRFFYVTPVVPQTGKIHEATVGRVTGFAAVSIWLIKATSHHDTSLRRERPAKSPGAVSSFTASIEALPLVILPGRILFGRSPVRRQPAPLTELDDPLIEIRITPQDQDVAHGIAIGVRNRIRMNLNRSERFGNLPQV